MSDILAENETVQSIGLPAVEAIKTMQNSLKSKENYLAYHRRVGISMCLEAMTTSPVESMNDVTKHGNMKVDSNMNLSKSVAVMTDGHDARIGDHMSKSLRSLNSTNVASQGPTKDDLEPIGQYLLDQSFENAITEYGAQIKPEEWIVFNFTEKSKSIDDDCYEGPWPRFPRFHVVHVLRVNRLNGQIFLYCSCQHHTR